MSIDPPFVRGYRHDDRPALYDICVRTAASGQDARGMYRSDDLMPDAFAGPYAQLEPDLAFVLDDPGAGRAVGYVVGTADTAAFARAYRAGWVPLMAAKYPPPPVQPWTQPDDWLLDLLYRPEHLVVPELADYPAHLHIDLLPGYQGAGHGRTLIETFFTAAAKAGAGGVHVAVAAGNLAAPGFYARLGFHEIEAGPDTVRYLGREL